MKRTSKSHPWWRKLPPLSARKAHRGCLLCPPITDMLDLSGDGRIGVGFGFAALTRDGKIVWSEDPASEWEDLMTFAEAERRAKFNPHHDWRIVLDSPLCGRTYQRHGLGLWVLVESNAGFA